MKILKLVNVMFAIVGLGLFIYHFFISNIDVNFNYVLSFLAFMFLFSGVEDVLREEQEKKPFSLYLLVAFVLFLGLGIELVKILV